MPRRSVLTLAERAALLAIPVAEDDLIRHDPLSEPDLAVVRQHRGGHNRLGFAVHLCLRRHPGSVFSTDSEPPAALLGFVAHQLRLDPALWPQDAQRAETHREQLVDRQAWLGLTPFRLRHVRQGVHRLTNLAGPGGCPNRSGDRVGDGAGGCLAARAHRPAGG